MAPVIGTCHRAGPHRETPRRGGTLTLLTPQGWGKPTRYDFYRPVRNLDWMADAICAEGLYTMDASGEPSPWLADRLEVDEASTHAEVHLRPGLRFHPHPCLGESSTPATAEDLRFSLEHHLSTNGLPLAGDASGTGSIGPSVARIWIDGETVHLETTSEVPALRALIEATILIPSAIEGCAALEDKDTFLPLTGPFRVVEASASQIVIEAFADYWGKDARGQALPYLDRIVLRQVSTPGVRVSRLLAGEAQVIELSDDPAEVFVSLDPRSQRLEARGALRGAHLNLARRGIEMSNTVVFFPLPNGPGLMENPALRQVVAMAASRQCGECAKRRSALQPTRRLLEPDQQGFDPKLSGPRYDLEGAHRALRALKAKLGELPPIAVGCRSSGRGYCLTLVKDLRAVGFVVDVAVLSPEKIFEAMKDGAFDLVEADWMQWGLLRKRPDLFLAGLIRFSLRYGFTEGAGTDLAEEAHRTPKEGRRLELIAALERHLLEEAIGIPVAREQVLGGDTVLRVLVAQPELRGWIDPVAGTAPMDLVALSKAWLAPPGTR